MATVNDWPQFRMLVDGMLQMGKPDHVTYMFRGQSDIRWGNLRPSLARLFKGWPVEQVLEIERAAIGEFQSQAILHLSPNIVLRTTDVMGWLSLMQHYRAPTRLLDWTASPYVAAYFAVAQGWEAAGADGVIWFFGARALSDKMNALGWKPKLDGFSTEAEKVAHINDMFFQASPPSRLHLVKRREREERMIAQQGGFTIGPNPLDDHAEVLEQALAGEGWPHFGQIVIPRLKKPEFLHYLRFMNISANALFPGIDGIGQSIEELVRLFPAPPSSPPPGTFVATT